MGIFAAQELAIVGGKIDDYHAPVAPQRARGFRDCRGGIIQIVENLVQSDQIGRCVRDRQIVDIALAHQAVPSTRMVQLGARHGQHFATQIYAQSTADVGREYLQHPPGTRTEVQQVADRFLVDYRQHRLLDLLLVHVQSADPVPTRGGAAEIFGSHRAACLTHPVQPATVRGHYTVPFGNP